MTLTQECRATMIFNPQSLIPRLTTRAPNFVLLFQYDIIPSVFLQWLSFQSLRPLLFSPSTFLGRSQSLLTTLSTDTPVNCKRLFYNLGERSYGSPANLPNLSEYLFIRDRVSQEERRIIAGGKGWGARGNFFYETDARSSIHENFGERGK